MNINTVVSLPVAADLSTYSYVAVKLTSTGIDLAGTGDRIIGTLLQGNVYPAIGQSAVGLPADVFLSAGNGFAFVTLGNATAITRGDELMQLAGGQFVKRATLAVTTQDTGDTLTATAHGLANGTPVTFSSITSTTGFSVGVTYYVVSTTANTFQIAATAGGAALALTTDGSAVLNQQAAALAVDSAPASSSGGVIRAIVLPQPGASYGSASVTYTGTGATVQQTTPTLITPVIGVATGTSLAVTAGLTSSGATGAGVGYATGAGGAITQGASRTTGVTLNTLTGAITLFNAAGSATAASFTVTNSTVAATDTIIVSQKSGTDLYEIFVTAVAAGSFKITSFTTGGTTTEQPVFNFTVLKGVAS